MAVHSLESGRQWSLNAASIFRERTPVQACWNPKIKNKGMLLNWAPCPRSCRDHGLAEVESESRARWNNAGSDILITAASRRAEATKNAMGSAPLGAAYPDSSLPISPLDPEDGYWQEILTRRITFALSVIYSMIFLLGVVGNGLAIFILGFCAKKTVGAIWCLHLAVANFIFACSLPLRITHGALELHWPFGKAMCKLNDSVAYLNLYASAYFLMALGAGHRASVRRSAWAQNPRRNRTAWSVAAGIWLLATAFSSPRIHFRRAEPSPIDEEVTLCFFSYGQSFRQAKVSRHIILACPYVFAFVVPSSVTAACHVEIAWRERHEGQGLKYSKGIQAVTVVFYLCWLPYHVSSFFESQYLETSTLLAAVIPLATGWALASSCVNPVLYVVIGYDFKARPRPSVLSAFGNVFGEASSGGGAETPAKPAAETNPPDL